MRDSSRVAEVSCFLLRERKRFRRGFEEDLKMLHGHMNPKIYPLGEAEQDLDGTKPLCLTCPQE